MDVAAPGLDIYSTLPNHANYFQQHNGDPLNYGSLWGTSMSAPFVSGLAALVWSTSYGTSAAAVRSRIESTADPVTGTGTYWQKGRINAYKAVAPSGAFLITTDTATQVNTNSAILNGIINGLGTASLTDVSFIWGPTFGGPYPNTTLTQSLSAPGPFSFALSGLAPGSTFYFKAKARSLSR